MGGKIKLIVITLVALIVLLSNCRLSYSQDSTLVNRLVLSIEPRLGFIAPHHDYMAYFLEKNVTGFQINFGLLTFGKKEWQRQFNYPQIGAGFYRSNLGNYNIYGMMNALYLYVDRRFLPLQNRFNFGNKISFGLSHINNQYNKNTNPFNMVIATAINVFIQYDFVAYYRINANLNLRWNIGLTHTSNGSIKEPNKGFNIVTTGLGLQYAFSDERNVSKSELRATPFLKNHQFNLGLLTGFKAISRFDNKLYSVVGITGEFLYQISSTSMIGGEISSYWDSSLKDEFNLEGDDSFNKLDFICIAFNPTYAIEMGRIYFTFQPGIYLKNSFNPYGKITNKVGLRYQINSSFFVSMTIKSHWIAKADFVEVGVRYNLIKNKRN